MKVERFSPDPETELQIAVRHEPTHIFTHMTIATVAKVAGRCSRTLPARNVVPTQLSRPHHAKALISVPNDAGSVSGSGEKRSTFMFGTPYCGLVPHLSKAKDEPRSGDCFPWPLCETKSLHNNRFEK